MGNGVELLDLCRDPVERSLCLLNNGVSDAPSEWGVVLLERWDWATEDFSGDSLDSDFLFDL